MTTDRDFPDTYTCVDCEAFQKFAERHFVVLSSPSKFCLSVADLHELLLPYSGKPCASGCGFTVPYIHKSYSGFVSDWLAGSGHVNQLDFLATSYYHTGDLYTNLTAKDCMTPPERPRCRHCSKSLTPANSGE